MERLLVVGKDKIIEGDYIYIPDPGGQVQNEGMEHEYGWQRIERDGRFGSIIGMEYKEIQLPIKRYERYWWEDVVAECEEILKLEGHAENPLASSLPNVIREFRGADFIMKDFKVVRVKREHYLLKGLVIDFIEARSFTYLKKQTKCWNCYKVFSDDRISMVVTDRGNEAICRFCADEFKNRGVEVVRDDSRKES
jgi:hypothetical protein